MVYYSVMTVDLPRKLPHVFFDSGWARGKQFGMEFAGSQTISLEGDFDKYFTTYFADQYHIDSLSFITPDVMWAMKEAADYDIEIVGNQLFLLGDLRDPSIQLPDMERKIMKIKSTLMQTTKSYRDNSLEPVLAKTEVHELGVRLARNLTRHYLTIVGLSAVFLFFLTAIIFGRDAPLWDVLCTGFITLMILGYLGLEISIVYDELKHRKRLRQSHAIGVATNSRPRNNQRYK